MFRQFLVTILKEITARVEGEATTTVPRAAVNELINRLHALTMIDAGENPPVNDTAKEHIFAALYRVEQLYPGIYDGTDPGFLYKVYSWNQHKRERENERLLAYKNGVAEFPSELTLEAAKRDGVDTFSVCYVLEDKPVLKRE